MTDRGIIWPLQHRITTFNSCVIYNCVVMYADQEHASPCMSPAGYCAAHKIALILLFKVKTFAYSFMIFLGSI